MSLRRMPRVVLVLGLASLLNDVASEMVFPLLPTFIVVVLGGSRTSLGMIEGAADSLASFLKLAAGHWSDRTRSRNRFVLAGYGLTAILRPLLSLTSAAWQVGGIRLADRFGKGIRAAPRDALIADATPADQRGRAFGFNRAMDHAGAALGPLVAALFLWLFPDQLRLLFALSVLPGMVLVALVGLGLPAAHRSDQARTPHDSIPPAPTLDSNSGFDRRFVGFLVSLTVFTLGNSSDAFLLVRAQELGVPTAWLPILWCVFHVAKSAGAWALGGWSDRFGPRPMILFGWFWYAGVYLLMALASAAWHVWALFLLYSVFYSFTESAEKSLVVRLVPHGRRGLAFGWFNFAVGIATLPASALFGFLYDRYGAVTAFGCGAGLALTAAVILLAATRHTDRQSDQGAANPP